MGRGSRQPRASPAERIALLAALEGDADNATVVKHLLAKNSALLNAKLGDNLHRPLHIAAFHGHQRIAKVLVDAGAGVNLRNRSRWTPLHCVAVGFARHARVAKLLIAAGAELNARDVRGDTPLALAMLHGHRAAVALLSRAGATE